jgi:hypothetical protein
VKNNLLLWVLPFALFACKGEGAKKGQEGAESEKEVEVWVGQTRTTDDYRETGLQYAMAVQATLGKTLQQKIKEEGTLGAIEFCNLNAMPITDSLSRELGASISRITDRPRNPQNKASDDELKLMSMYREDFAEGHTPEGIVILRDDKTHFYYPIVTNSLCLQCHGTPDSEISPEVYSKIQELYPEDRATAYSSEQLRGLWKVSFPEEQP